MAIEIKTDRVQQWDLGYINNRWVVPTEGAESMLFTGEAQTAWGAAKVTLYLSADGILPVPNAATQELNSTALSAIVDCANVPFVIAKLSTIGTASTYANLEARKSISR